MYVQYIAGHGLTLTVADRGGRGISNAESTAKAEHRKLHRRIDRGGRSIKRDATVSLTFVFQVSFNSKSNEGLRIQQLSGGQKSLVALATGKLVTAHEAHIADFVLCVQYSPSRNVTPRHSTCLTRLTPT